MIQEDEASRLTTPTKFPKGWGVLGLVQEERDNQLEWANHNLLIQ